MTSAVKIPASYVKNRLVDGTTCAAARTIPGLVPDRDKIEAVVVGYTAAIGRDGSDLEDVNMWLAGPLFNLTLDASALHPSVDQATKINITVDPEVIRFQTNLYMSDWFEGQDAIASEEIKITGTIQGNVDMVAALPFSYRWQVSTITNTKMARLSLHMVPCPVNTMEMLPDPYSAEIKVATVYAANINWATLPHTSWAMPGGFPLLMDRRSQQAKDSDTFPSSWQIKTFCYDFLKGCLRNPALTDEEAAAVILAPTQPPPSDPNGVIRALWAPLKAEALPDGAHSADESKTPSSVRGPEASSGLPPIFNKAASAINAKKALERQSGRLGSPDDDINADSYYQQQSAAADLMERTMKGVYGDSLPTGIPPWEDLSTFTPQAVMGIIDKKIERESQNLEISSLSAFEKATAVVDVPAGKDDGVNYLHEARWFSLPYTPPIKWADKQPVAREHVVAIRNLKHLGLESKFPLNAIKKMHNRSKRLKLVELLSANANVEDSEPLLKRKKTGDAGDRDSLGIVPQWNFEPAKRPWEALEAVAEALAINQILFPTDHSYVVILLTLLKYQLFYDPKVPKKVQMKTITVFVNDMLQRNATKAGNRLDAEDIDAADKVALNALRATDRPPVTPPIRDYMAGMSTEDNAERSNFSQNTGGRGRGRGNSGFSPSPTPGPAAPGKPKPGIPAKNIGPATCPSFNKGAPCPRVSDQSSRMCSAKDGTILYHRCSKCGASDHNKSTHK